MIRKRHFIENKENKPFIFVKNIYYGIYEDSYTEGEGEFIRESSIRIDEECYSYSDIEQLVRDTLNFKTITLDNCAICYSDEYPSSFDSTVKGNTFRIDTDVTIKYIKDDQDSWKNYYLNFSDSISDEEFKDWENDKLKLYSCHIHIYCNMIFPQRILSEEDFIDFGFKSVEFFVD